MKGKPWSVDEEKQLRELVAAKTPFEVIAAKLGRGRDAVTIKCKRLGLEVVVANCYSTTTTSLKVPEELPSVEEALLKLAGALEAACKPGLDKVEVQRLQVVASIAKTYKDIFADYLDYRGLEVELVDLREKYEAFSKKSKNI
jgi:hypothetical protein